MHAAGTDNVHSSMLWISAGAYVPCCSLAHSQLQTAMQLHRSVHYDVQAQGHAGVAGAMQSPAPPQLPAAEGCCHVAQQVSCSGSLLYEASHAQAAAPCLFFQYYSQPGQHAALPSQWTLHIGLAARQLCIEETCMHSQAYTCGSSCIDTVNVRALCRRMVPAFRAWSLATRRRVACARLVRHSLARWRQSAKFKAFNGWRQAGATLAGRRRLLQHGLMRWRHHCLSRAFSGWQAAMQLRAARRKAARWAVTRWQDCLRFRALHGWQEAAAMRASHRSAPMPVMLQ